MLQAVVFSTPQLIWRAIYILRRYISARSATGARAGLAAIFVLACCTHPAPAQDRPAPRSIQQAHEEAVRMARSGQMTEALATLERLSRQAPGDRSITWDRVVILTWADRDAEAVKIYEALPADHAPDYVVAAVAKAYRDLHRYPQALGLYRKAEQLAPADPGFAAGEIRTLTDMGDNAAAIAAAERILGAQGDSVDVLLAASDAALAAKTPVDALRYADRALRIAPADRDARRQRIIATAAMGAPDLALNLAKANPGLMTAAELDRLEAAAAAELVRFGETEPRSEAERFAATDRAIAALDALIARWSQEGKADEPSVIRARLDRLIALHDRLRMKEVVAEFQALQQEKVDIPDYVLPVVADAYLTLREPETAVYLYRWALDLNPKDTTARIGLSRALIETEDFGEALRQVDTAAAALPPWLYLKGLREPIPNDEKFGADVAAANARLYADDLPEAQKRFAAMTDMAPNNVTARLGLAKVYDARGWPRLAQQEIDIAKTQAPPDFDVAAAEARSALGLQDWRRAEVGVAELNRRFPEGPDTESLNRAWDTHNRWELHVFAERDIRSATSVAGGSGLSLGAQLYSPPIAEDWRAYGGYRLAHERVPEGHVTERLYDTGVEYRHLDLTASAEARFATVGTDYAGGKLAAAWAINDQWELSGGGEVFSDDTPLRALLHRITADSANLALLYRESESRDVKLGAQEMPFSDGNLRTVLSAHGDQRLYTDPHVQLNGTVDLGASQNTRTDAPYFNPRHDASGDVGLDLTQILYRRYDFSYRHRLVAGVGPYWEQRFGTGFVWGVRYEQTVKEDDVCEGTLGLAFSRQPYDGAYENNIAITFSITSRF